MGKDPYDGLRKGRKKDRPVLTIEGLQKASGAALFLALVYVAPAAIWAGLVLLSSLESRKKRSKK